MLSVLIYKCSLFIVSSIPNAIEHANNKIMINKLMIFTLGSKFYIAYTQLIPITSKNSAFTKAKRDGYNLNQNKCNKFQ